MDERDVVTVFLTNAGDVLLLRRSEDVGSYSGRWGGVAGHVEDTPETAARREIREETGLDRETVELVSRGDPFSVSDEDLDIVWTVHPFRFSTDTRSIEPNWETTDFEWVDPPTIRKLETVPELWTSWDRVRPTVESVAGDTTSGSAKISRRALEVLRDEAALAAERDDWTTIEQVALDLRAAREEMAVVRVRIDRVMAGASETRSPEAVREGATEALKRAIEADQAAAENATALIEDRTVFTLSRSGTVERAIETADPEAINVAVSRPGGEGEEVAETLAERGHDVTLYGDSNIPRAVREAAVVLVGADTIRPTGAVINKVGTMTAALSAARVEVPCYVAAATAKISPVERSTDSKPAIDPDSVIGPKSIRRVDPPFERTPADLIDGVITEDGILDEAGIRAVASRHAALARWMPNR